MKNTLLLGTVALGLTATAMAQPGATALASQELDRQSTSILSTSGTDFGVSWVNATAGGYLENAGNPSLVPTSLLVYQLSVNNGLASGSPATLRLQTSTDSGKTFSPAANSRAIYTFNTTPNAFFSYEIVAYENHVFVFFLDAVVNSVGAFTNTEGIYAIGSDDQGQTFSAPVLLSTYADPAVSDAPGSFLDLLFPGYLSNPGRTLALDNAQELQAGASLASSQVSSPLTGRVYAAACWEAQFRSSPYVSGVPGFDNGGLSFNSEEEVYFQSVYVERVMGVPVLRTAFPNEVVLTEEVVGGLGLHGADADNPKLSVEGDVVAVLFANEDDLAIGAPAMLARNTIEVRVSVDGGLDFASPSNQSIRLDDFSAAFPSTRQSDDLAIDIDNGKVYCVSGFTQVLVPFLSGPDTLILSIIDTNSGTPTLVPGFTGSSTIVWPLTDPTGTITFDGFDADQFSLTVEDGTIVVLTQLDINGSNSNEVFAFVDRNDGQDMLNRSAEVFQLTTTGTLGNIHEAVSDNAVFASAYARSGFSSSPDGDEFVFLSTDGGQTFRNQRVTESVDGSVNFSVGELALTRNGALQIAMQDLETGPVITTGQRFPRIDVTESVVSGTTFETFSIADEIPGSLGLLLLDFGGTAPNDLKSVLGLNSPYDATVCLTNGAGVFVSFASAFGVTLIGPDGRALSPLVLPQGVFGALLPGFSVDIVGLTIRGRSLRSYTDPFTIQ